MLSMSMDRIESTASNISSRLKDITKQLKKPLAEFNDKKTKVAIDSVIEEMHQLDDMVHEPSYENDCLVDYWTLGSLHRCVLELREVTDLLADAPLDEKLLGVLRAKMEEANYLWNDNYVEDFGRWAKKVSGFAQPAPESEHSYNYKPLFAKVSNERIGYGLVVEQDNSDEKDLAEALGISKFTR